MRVVVPKAWGVLEPFHRPYLRFLAGVAARQILLIAGGYSLVLLLHKSIGSVPIWACIAVLLLYDSGLLGLDLRLNISFVQRVSFPMFAYLRSITLGKVFEMPAEWLQRQQTSALAGKINEAVGKVVQTVEGFGRELCPALIRTLLVLVPLVYFSPWTIVFVICAAGMFAAITAMESQRRQPYRKARHQNYARDFGMFSECIENLQPVVHFGQTGRMLGEYRQLQQEIAGQGIEDVRLATRYSARRNFLLSIAKRACQGIWIWQFRKGSLDGAMVMYLNAMLEDLFNSFSGYAGLIERVYDGLEPTRTLVTLLDERSSIRSNAVNLVEMPEAVGIEFQDVRFAYGNGPDILHNFSLKIEPGTVLGIVGRSGIGKTTIQHVLSRMYDVQQGRIAISGTDIREWPLEQLRGIFSSVSQNGGVFFSGMTILDTIRFARPDANFGQAIDAAKLACIHDEIMRMPDGYFTKTGQRGSTLSKGQQQRIALAQALLAFEDRKVLILDEFTSALDSQTEQEVLGNLMPLLKGKTVIIIAHRLATLRKIADKIIVLDDTGIVEYGDHSELLSRGGAYAQIARLQATTV
ncbi:MAG: ABC transporter ATP-binding protein [Bryobacterales bacterium]|nr:ABC transporter ATP-binding protein [Bryobacterales bacterium]